MVGNLVEPCEGGWLQCCEYMSLECVEVCVSLV